MPPLDVQFPVKGWHTQSPVFAQPEGTSADLLNVLALDVGLRARGAQRPGVKKSLATPAGTPLSTSAVVQTLAQTVVASDPASLQPAVGLPPIATDDFTVVTDYPLGGNIEAKGRWLVYNHLDNRGISVHQPNNVIVQSVGGAVAGREITVTSGVIALYQGVSLNPLGSYVVEALITIAPTANSEAFTVGVWELGNGNSCGARLLTSTSASTITVFTGGYNTGTTYTFSTPLAAGDYVLQLRQNGNALEAWFGTTHSNTLFKIGVTNVAALASNTAAWIAFDGGIYGAGGYGNIGIKTFSVYGAQPLAQYRKSVLMAVCHGNIYWGSNGIGSAMILASAGGGVSQPMFLPYTRPRAASVADVNGAYTYFVDGIGGASKKWCRINLSNGVIDQINSFKTGTTETSTTLALYQLACVWRQRLVLAGSTTYPQTMIASRQGDSLDFDYAQLDAGAAFAIAPNTTALTSGGFSDVINCLIPWSDDILIVGGDHTIYRIEGDPTAGGAVVVASQTIGTQGPDCWAIDPKGVIWFVGIGGLYKMQPGTGSPEIVSGAVSEYFAGINRTSQYVSCVWDINRDGMHIFITSVGSGTSKHMYFDPEDGAFFPIQYPDTFGPISSMSWAGDTQAEREVLLGGRDGYIRQWSLDQAVLDDDGVAVSSHVLLGPYRPSSDERLDAFLTSLQVMMAEAPPVTSVGTAPVFGMQVQILAGKDAPTALAAATAFTATIANWSRLKRYVQRIRGGVFYVKLLNTTKDATWALEKISLNFEPGGLQQKWGP